MIELILCSVILALVITNVYLFSRMMDMNEKYMKAFMAKNLQDLTTNEIIKEDSKKPQPVKQEPVPLEQASDSVFNKFIENVENGQNESSEI